MKIREVQPADVPGIARVHVDSWRGAYSAIVPDALIATLAYETTADRWQQHLFEQRPVGLFALAAEAEDGELAGILSAGPEETGEPRAGQVFVLYIHPAYQRRGIGQALVAAAAERLLAQGLDRLVIWVLADNAKGRAFYEAVGGTRLGEKMVKIRGYELREVAYSHDTRALIEKLKKSRKVSS